jgi:phosphatidylglycerol:prolipoprotein diacylglycerol transferase
MHNLNPIALPIHGNLAIRWYGLAYLMGFVAAFLLLRYLARKKLWVMAPEKTADFIAATALFGVFIGGRIGWILMYYKDGLFKDWGFNSAWLHGISSDPLVVFRVWEGGMASHGGILGLAIFTWVYARKNKVSWAGLSDGLCVVGPIGLMFGRAANFINGELYGRVAYGFSGAMKFPRSLIEEPQSVQDAAWQACTRVDPSLAHANSLEQLITSARVHPEVSRTLAEYLQPRYPSQIYEGLLEGALLFLILWTVRMRFKNAPYGLITGLFFALYAIFRIFGEQFREPDATLVGTLSRGQFFSLFMFIFSACFLVYAWMGRNRLNLAKNASAD